MAARPGTSKKKSAAKSTINGLTVAAAGRLKPGTLVDKLYELRTNRIALSNQVDAIKRHEAELAGIISEKLTKLKFTSAKGDVASFTPTRKRRAKAHDWDKFYAYVKKANAFELLHRRLSDAAVFEILDGGSKVPGIEVDHYDSYSLTKVSKK